MFCAGEMCGSLAVYYAAGAVGEHSIETLVADRCYGRERMSKVSVFENVCINNWAVA
jgi:hypothetical protein